MMMPNYFVSNNDYPDLVTALLEKGFKNVALIGGERALNAAQPKIEQALENSDVTILGRFVYGKECTQANISRLAEEDAIKNCDVIFAVGGGKALDTAKCVSLEVNKAVFSFPTICSNCAAMTAIAVVYKEDGSVLKYAFPHAPTDIFIDLATIAEAPDIYFWAGVGDGISKQAEVLFASQGDDLSHMARLGVGIAKTCEAPLLTYGAQGLEDVKKNKVSRAVEEVALTILVSTGYVSNLTNQDDFYYNSSLAHVFFDTTCAIKRPGKYLHGEVVAFGVMVLHAYCGDEVALDKIARFNASMGLPITLDAIGLKEEDVDEMLKHVPDTIEYKRSSQVISLRRFKEAILAADDYGKHLF